MKVKKKICASLLILLSCLAVDAGWSKQESGTLARLQSIYFIDQNNGWAVGSSGTFLSTADGGKVWKKSKKFTGDNLKDVYFSDRERGWILGERSIYVNREPSPTYLLETTDGGATWEKVEFPKAAERVTRVFSAPNGPDFAVGESGAFWTRKDKIVGWKRAELPVRFLLLDGGFADETNGLLVGAGGAVLFTENGGEAWNQAVLADGAKGKLNAVFIVDANLAFAVGQEGKIYSTTNGGKFWRPQTSGVPENLTDVFFVSAREGTVVGENGMILRTQDGGEKWEIEPSAVRHKLEKVFFVGKKGYAVGFGGTILTTDGNDAHLREPQLKTLR